MLLVDEQTDGRLIMGFPLNTSYNKLFEDEVGSFKVTFVDQGGGGSSKVIYNDKGGSGV